ncbi:hypothetical protein DFJ73DRAFT_568815 [Zopfochytrium polystomum]|nr:hypothetical protein DFJ73DRAFT_568815 [Zopfochytrium polystomum]
MSVCETDRWKERERERERERETEKARETERQTDEEMKDTHRERAKTATQKERTACKRPRQPPRMPPPPTTTTTAASTLSSSSSSSSTQQQPRRLALAPYTLVDYEQLEHDAPALKFLADTDPDGSWHCFSPPDDYIVQFARPVAVSRVALLPVNTGHSPRAVRLYCDESLPVDAAVADTNACRWRLAAVLSCPDKNRNRMFNPPNGDPEEGTTSFDAYLWGDDAVDDEARPDVWPLKNRVLAYPPSYDDEGDGANKDATGGGGSNATAATARKLKLAPVFNLMTSRRWRLEFLDLEGEDESLEWVGINDISFYGLDNPAPAPRNVLASRVPAPTASANTGATVSWEYADADLAAHSVSGFRVLLHNGGPSLCPQYHVDFTTAEAAAGPAAAAIGRYKVELPECLPPNHAAAFSVAAIHGAEREGVPSSPSNVVCGPIGVEASALLGTDHAASSIELHDALVRAPVAPSKPGSADASKRPAAAGKPAKEKKAKKGAASATTTAATAEARQRKAQEQKTLSQRLYGDKIELALSWEDVGRQREADIVAVLCGTDGFAAAQRVFDYSTAKVFLSSTFADTQVERNYIMDHGVPVLRDVCRSLGLSFQLEDLRWGISDEMTDNHMTEDICINLVKECRKTSIATSFVLFSGYECLLLDEWRESPFPPQLCLSLNTVLSNIP